MIVATAKPSTTPVRVLVVDADEYRTIQAAVHRLAHRPQQDVENDCAAAKDNAAWDLWRRARSLSLDFRDQAERERAAL